MSQERARRAAVAQSLCYEREVEKLEPPAAVFLVYMQARDTDLYHSLPERSVESSIGFEDLSQIGGRALALHKTLDRLLEKLLFIGKIEIHLLELRPA